MPARALLSVCAGLCLWLSFPGFDLWWLAPVGVAAMALACAGAGALRGGVLGLITGLVYFLPLLHWSGIFVGALPWVALSTAQALYVAALGMLAGWWGTRGSPRDVPVRPLALALGWVVIEIGRASWPYGGFGWGRLGFSQADAPVVGVASVLGTPGVAFMVTLTGGMLALGVQRASVLKPRRAAAIALLAAAVAAYCVPAAIPRPTDGEMLQVMGVQGNVPQLGLDFNAQRRAVLDNHATATIEAAQRISTGELAQPDLVVWPENSSDIDPFRNADAAEVIDEAVQAVDAPVLVGALQRSDSGRPENVSLLWTPQDGVIDRYIKQRPVPFAEYIPHRDFYRLFSPHVDRVNDFIPGTEVGVLELDTADGAVQLGVGICFEVILDDVMRDTVRSGAEILIIPTNNATFGVSHESVQQLAASRVKAVELGRSVVHVSTVGVSALITPDGQAHQVSELFTRAVLSGELPLRSELTLATRLGGWPEITAVAAMAVLIGMRVMRRSAVRLDSPELR